MEQQDRMTPRGYLGRNRVQETLGFRHFWLSLDFGTFIAFLMGQGGGRVGGGGGGAGRGFTRCKP